MSDVNLWLQLSVTVCLSLLAATQLLALTLTLLLFRRWRKDLFEAGLTLQLCVSALRKIATGSWTLGYSEQQVNR